MCGGSSPVSFITDPISEVLGTDGGGGGLLGTLADIDPGPAIGEGLATLDKGVNEIPGGWYTVGGLAAGGTGLYFAPEIMAAIGAEAGTTIGTELGKETFFTALANGATGSEAVSAGLAAEAATTGGALTTDQILSSTGFTPTPGSGASFVIDPNAIYTTGATQGAPVYDYSQPYNPGQAGPTYQELGVTGVEGGMAGPTYGELGYTGLNQAEAIAAADAASKGLTGAEALKYINNAKKALDTAGKLSKILSPSTGQSATGGSNSLDLGKLASMLNAPQQANSFIGQIKGNQNPFLFNVPGQTVASEGMYDVSGSNFAKANALRNYKA